MKPSVELFVFLQFLMQWSQIVCESSDYDIDISDDCTYGDWGDWGPCTAPCGGGVRTRHKFLELTPFASQANANATLNCVAAQSDVDKCNKQPCSSDCITSGWTVWGHCNCRKKTKTRSRQVLKWQSHGGKKCPKLLESTDCAHECIQDCKVSQWSDWSECSATCGGFSQAKRRRTITKDATGGGKNCPKLAQTRECPKFECPNVGSFCLHQPDGFYPNPRQVCSRTYLSCSGQTDYWKTCPTKLVFDADTKRCDRSSRIAECVAVGKDKPTERTYMPLRNAALVSSFAVLLLLIACLIRALSLDVTCCRD